METIERDYSDKGVGFYYVYKALAHPEWNGYVTPYTMDERLMHVAEAKRTLGTRFHWLVDTEDNVLKTAMGNAPNSEWIIDENNVIVGRRDWSSPTALRADLEQLVGAVEHPTMVDDLDMPSAPPLKAAASGVVPRLKRAGRMSPVKVEPVFTNDNEPFYAKLRAEAGRELLTHGEGQLYLRFMLDPLYGVHWNNLVKSIEVKIEASAGVTVTPEVLSAPEVEVDADIDPREFLVDIAGAKTGDALTIKAHYFACHDEEGWCKPLSQEYTVVLERDRNGGFVIPDEMAKMMSKRMDEMQNATDTEEGERARKRNGGRRGSNE